MGAPEHVPPAAPDRAAVRPPRVVAFGGGHGLAAALAAWRQITPELTAVVTVADDGGSSGRIRREMPVLPPGDLRMALSALAGDDAGTRQMAALLQHRFGGSGVLAGHPVGNLMLTGLTELHGGDTVRALDDLCRLLGACGRVLPMADVPLDLVARVESSDPDDPARTRTIRGQVAIATTPGRVREIKLSPADPPVHPAVGGAQSRPRLLVHLGAAAPAGAAAPRRARREQRPGRRRPQPRAAAGGDRRLLAGGAPDGAAEPSGRSGIAHGDRRCGIGG